MSEAVSGKPPRSFWIIATIALLWNLVGVLAYVMQVNMSDEAMSALSEAERMLYESTPAWVTATFAVAVVAGTLGSLLLLLRKAWAVPVLLLSLLAILLQMFHNLFLSPAVEVLGMQAIAFPIVVVAIAVFLVWYSRVARKEAWLA